jgi:hypothetical protein
MKLSHIRRSVGLSMVVAVGVLAGTSASFAISQDAQLIVDGVTAAGGASKPACSDVSALTKSVTDVTTQLAVAGKLKGGDPKAAGKEAGEFLYANCK